MEECAWLEAVLNKHGYERSISRVLNVKMESAVPEGNNYASLIYRATLDVILRSGNRTKLTLILKKEHVDKETLEMLKDISVFKGEIKFYTEVLTKFEQLMDEYQDSSDKLWCDLIGYKSYSAIVFEDLKRTNFRMADRKKFLDKNHSLLVLNSLGRFHAMGYALIKRGMLKKVEDFQPFYLKAGSPIFRNMYEGGMKMLCQVMQSDWSMEWKEVSGRLFKQIDVIFDRVQELFVAPENAFQTVCHGDCWTCNMMFKYCPYDDTLPVAFKFLDFQTTHINSYGLDVTYFLYISVHPEVRRAHWDDLIVEYQKSLSNSLTLYGLTDPAPTLKQINEEIKRLEYYGFAMSTICLPISTAEVERPFCLEKLIPGQDGSAAFNPEIFNGEQYKLAVQSDLKKWMLEGLF